MLVNDALAQRLELEAATATAAPVLVQHELEGFAAGERLALLDGALGSFGHAARAAGFGLPPPPAASLAAS
jgi:hypothetical protein